MELKDFIQQTLEQIVEGVSSAQVVIEKKGGIVNPTEVSFQKDGTWNLYKHGIPHSVEFDVGLTSIDKKGSSEGIGVFLGSVNLGKKNDTGVEHTAITKVKF